MIYIDTSVFLRSVLDQDPAGAVARQRERVTQEGALLISSQLLRLEARRAQIRTGRTWAEVEQELEHLHLTDVDEQDFEVAFTIKRHMKTLDALHLASCIKVEADALLTADQNMREVAEYLGIDVRWAG